MGSIGDQKYSPYEIPLNPDPLHFPARKLRVVCIGASFAGLNVAYKLKIQDKFLAEHVDLRIYDRQHDAGGTWLANRYPGLTCDVPIHIYTIPWAPKHDWSRFMAGGAEIRQYIKDVTKKFDFNRFITYNTLLKEAVWNEESGRWKLYLETPDGRLDDECDILIGAYGTQNTPLKPPSIPGLDSFKGPVVHTGNWDDSLDWHGKRIAVIGNGSSGIQTFGAMQPNAGQITHYIRSATWISLNYMSQFTRDGNGRNFEYTQDEKEAFKSPEKIYEYRCMLEKVSNLIFKNLVYDGTMPEFKKKFRQDIEKLMHERVRGNQELVDKLVPTYDPWCRRLTPGDGYLESLLEPNARLIKDSIVQVTDNGIRTESGEEVEYDIIIVATGFVNSRVQPWKMIGRNGETLEERWKDDADGYLSVAAPGMPNYFTIGCGPNFTIANGPVQSALEHIGQYIANWATKLLQDDIKSICIKDEVVAAFNIYIQQVLRRTVWNRSCESWYKKGRADEYRTGISAIYPGSMYHFRKMLDPIRPEDFEIRYRSANIFKFYGCGLTEDDLSADLPDLSKHLSKTMKLDNIM